MFVFKLMSRSQTSSAQEWQKPPFLGPGEGAGWNLGCSGEGRGWHGSPVPSSGLRMVSPLFQDNLAAGLFLCPSPFAL